MSLALRDTLVRHGDSPDLAADRAGGGGMWLRVPQCHHWVWMSDIWQLTWSLSPL